MENGREMISSDLVVASSPDDTAQDDDVSPSAESRLNDVSENAIPSTDSTDTFAGNEPPVSTCVEAPAPQAYSHFDIDDDPLPEMDITIKYAQTTADDENTIAVEPSEVLSDQSFGPDTASTFSASATEEELFEQVMGSSRLEDIPVARRSAPGSIPLPPQVVLEQQRREQTIPRASDSQGRNRYPLPDAAQRSNRHGEPSRTQSVQPSQASHQSLDVICPKCQRTTSTRFTFCMKCGIDFPVGYVASLTAHHPQPTSPAGHDSVRDTRTTVRQINRIHEARENTDRRAGSGTNQTTEQEWSHAQSGLASNPFLVAFLSFLMPGLGHMLLGEHKKGLPWLFAGIAAMAFLPSWTFLLWIPVFLRVFSSINAYQLAIIKQDEQTGRFDSDDDA